MRHQYQSRGIRKVGWGRRRRRDPRGGALAVAHILIVDYDKARMVACASATAAAADVAFLLAHVLTTDADIRCLCCCTCSLCIPRESKGGCRFWIIPIVSQWYVTPRMFFFPTSNSIFSKKNQDSARTVPSKEPAVSLRAHLDEIFQMMQLSAVAGIVVFGEIRAKQKCLTRGGLLASKGVHVVATVVAF